MNTPPQQTLGNSALWWQLLPGLAQLWSPNQESSPCEGLTSSCHAA